MINILKKYLIDINLTQQDFAKELGISYSLLSAIFQNKRRITIEVFEKIKKHILKNNKNEIYMQFNRAYRNYLEEEYKDIIQIIRSCK